MKIQITPTFVNVAIGFFFGVCIALTGVVIYNDIQFRAECDGEIVENWYGKERCVIVTEQP